MYLVTHVASFIETETNQATPGEVIPIVTATKEEADSVAANYYDATIEELSDEDARLFMGFA